MATTTRRNWLSLVAVVIAISTFFSIQKPWSSQPSASNATTSNRSFVTGKNNTVLLVTNSEHGLRNVVLATANSLLTRYPEIDLHIASFDKLAPRVQELQQYSRKQSPSASITFHRLPGLSFGDAIFAEHSKLETFTMQEAATPPGVFGTMKLANSIPKFFMPWTGPQYLEMYDAMVRVLDKINPAVVALDPTVSPAVDAVVSTKRNWVVLSANGVRDNAPMEQGAAMLWKFPM